MDEVVVSICPVCGGALQPAGGVWGCAGCGALLRIEVVSRPGGDAGAGGGRFGAPAGFSLVPGEFVQGTDSTLQDLDSASHAHAWKKALKHAPASPTLDGPQDGPGELVRLRALVPRRVPRALRATRGGDVTWTS